MSRHPGARRAWPVVAALVALPACRTHEPDPIDPRDVLAVVEARRAPGTSPDVVTLADAIGQARGRAPGLLSLRVAAETAAALAELPTPLSNPSVGVGPILLSGSEITSGTRWGVEAVGGWLLDLTGSRAAATELRAAEAAAARVELAAAERRTYLALRRAFTRLAAARARRAAVEEVARASGATERVASRLVEAAQATALDVVELRVEARRAAADVVAARESEQDARDALAALTGIAAGWFADVESPTPPAEAPPRERLGDLMVSGHPELDALRAEHSVAEARLRAELSARLPGLDLEPGYEYEERTDRWSLGLGFELPLFDRNEIAITAAEGRRREIRARYEAAVTSRLTAIDAALGRLARRTERLALLAGEAEPDARRALRLAEAALRAGALDGLRYLTVARTERSVRLDRLAAEQAVLEAWCDLEEACGTPLLGFASTRTARSPSAATDAPGAAGTEGEER